MNDLSPAVEVTRTASDDFLEAMAAGGLDVCFAVLGTDHPAIIESFAKHEKSNRAAVPTMVVCQHENVAINAALGYAHFSGKAQGVIAHVDVGTLNIGLGLHNASRNRLPVFVYAGVAPYTECGEQLGGRQSYIQYVQDVYDQPGSAREYLKWEYEVRAGSMFRHAVARGLQIAQAAPAGPVYVTSAREPLEEAAEGGTPFPVHAEPVRTLPDHSVLEKLTERVAKSNKPVLVTMSGGREADGAAAIASFAHALAVPVVDMRSVHVNLAADHPMHMGYHKDASQFVGDADMIIVVECDAPWMPVEASALDSAEVVHIGLDPMSEMIPMRTHRSDLTIKASPALVLSSMAKIADDTGLASQDTVLERRKALTKRHDEVVRKWDELKASDGRLTVSSLAAAIADEYEDDALVVQETTTAALAVLAQLRKCKSGTLMSPAGSGLGMGLAAAFGAKLAFPEKEVVCLQGDGSYALGSPLAAHWNAMAYGAPFLTVVFNNSGWKAVEHATRSLHPTGFAARSGVTATKFDPGPEISKVIEAANGVGIKVTTLDQAIEAIRHGRKLVGEGKSVVIDARLEE